MSVQTSTLDTFWREYHALEREMGEYRSRTDDEGIAKFDEVRDQWLALGEKLKGLRQLSHCCAPDLCPKCVDEGGHRG